MRIYKERQHEDLRIPEHVALIALAGQRPRPWRRIFVLGVGAADQMVYGEPCLALDFVVTGDLYVRCIPPLGPGPSTAFEQGRHADPNRLLQPLGGSGSRIRIVTRGEHRNDLAHGVGPTLDCIEAPSLD